MRYLVNLYGNESDAAEPGTAEFEAELSGYDNFGDIAGEAIVAGEALQLTETAVTVHSGTDVQLVTDGPYAEATEVIGGFYTLEAASLDEAIELARKIPAATVSAGGHGGVELRPLVQWWTNQTDADETVEDTTAGDRYLAMIYGKETPADIPNTPEWEQGAAEHGAFIDKHRGALLAGAALHPAATATTVRVRDGKLDVTDGPFAETAEVIGGLYLLRAATRDEAAAIARDIPTNPAGGVELRPIMELDG